MSYLLKLKLLLISILLSCVLSLLFPLLLSAQTVTGKLINQDSVGLSGLDLYLFISPNVYNTISDSEGSFTFNNVTGIRKNILPAGFSVSENYPNPFNPRTRILITLPDNGMVNVNVVNILGQKVIGEIKKYYTAGTNAIDLELKGLPNGIYFARVTINDQFTVVKKLMLLYGSQHLYSAGNDLNSFSALSKSKSGHNTALESKIDSLVVIGSSVGKKVITNLPPLIGNSLNLGDLLISEIPAPPKGVQAINGDNRVDLRWVNNHEADLAGYNIYYSTAYNGKYTFKGSSNSNYYLDDAAKNGVINYYAVTAYNSGGIESGLSKDIVYATPRPEGFNQFIFDYRTYPAVSGYSFSDYSVVPFDSSATDFFFENYNGTFYLDVYTDTDILDAGPTNDIYDIPFAPNSGWSATKDAVAVVGHTYIIWTWDDHYAKIRVKNIANERIVFDWAYQLVAGNKQLKPIAGRNGSYRAPLFWSSIRK